jgi:ABC-2 type transport system ATP-binding protein
MSLPAHQVDVVKNKMSVSKDAGNVSQSEFAISAVNLCKTYGEARVVDNLNLNVRAGELYALLGDNGAGKTTTISMLTTLLKPSAGEFFICGLNGIKQAEKIKGSFGIVSQDIAIYRELTAFENLWFIAQLHGIPRKQALERIEMLLERSGLTDKANQLVGTFSGGMQRKLTIASALLHAPKVLFMDEPTVGLDPAARRQIWQTLKGLRNSGVTILLTTHYLEEAELLADRIGIIRQGKIVVEGTIDELRHKIQGIRSIAIRITGDVAPDILQNKIDKLPGRFSSQVKFDPLRNTLSFAQPKDSQLVKILYEILNWLEQEKIPFTRFATSEPNLEEVFMALTLEPHDDDEPGHFPISEDVQFEHDYT